MNMFDDMRVCECGVNLINYFLSGENLEYMKRMVGEFCCLRSPPEY